MSETPESSTGDRRRQLVAAAVALRTWVNEQRDAWPQRPERPPAGVSAPTAGRSLSPGARSVGPGFSSGAGADSGAAERVAAAKAGRRKANKAADKPIEKLEALSRPGTLLSIASSPRAEDFHDINPAPIDEPADGDDGASSGGSSWIARAGLGVAVLAVIAVMGYVGWSKRTEWMATPDAAPKMGTAVLESVPPGSDVFIDGTPAGRAPVTKQLEAGRHMVEFRRRASSRKLQVQVVAGRQIVERLDWTAKRKGSLEILTEPDGASVSVDGAPRGVTPLTIDDLTVGTHAVVLESNSGSISRTVTISPDKVAQITEAIYSGWLHVSSPIEVQVVEGARSLLLDERNQLLLPPGVHDLQIGNPALAYKERHRVEIKPGRIAEVTIAPPSSHLSVTASLPAEVIIDGKSVGEAPLVNFPIDMGTRSVVVKSITGPERRFTVTATVKPTTLDVDFSKQ